MVAESIGVGVSGALQFPAGATMPFDLEMYNVGTMSFDSTTYGITVHETGIYLISYILTGAALDPGLYLVGLTVGSTQVIDAYTTPAEFPFAVSSSATRILPLQENNTIYLTWNPGGVSSAEVQLFSDIPVTLVVQKVG
jgi:hypothetical protein